MEQYNVTGMSCAACSTRVEKAVSAVEGVSSVSVSLLANSMGVEGTASPSEIIRAVENAGYGASVKGRERSAKSADELDDKETPMMIKRLIASVIVLLPLMYLSMGHMMLGWKLPPFFDGNHVAMGLVQLLLTAVIMVINQKFFISGFKAVIHRSPNMDTLVATGSGISFLRSVYVLFHMTGAVAAGDEEAVMSDMMNFYFEAAAMILTLITVGKTLEAYSKGKTTNALRGLMELSPKTAVVERNGREQTIPAEQVQIGDVFVVRPGEHIPVDGVVIDGTSAVDESALTGESIPADKITGGCVSAGTVNQSGSLRCRAVKVGENTTLSQIIRMVSDAAATKAPVAKLADRVSGVFVPAVIGISLVTLVIWLAVGQTVGYALARAISVLVISCPCALGLATPVSIMVGSGVGAKNGILFKTAVSLEETGKAQIVVLDKTGTITKGEPSVTDIIPLNTDEKTLIETAYALEQKSEHPLAKAIVTYAEGHETVLSNVTDFKALYGSGLTARLGNTAYFGGNAEFIGSKVTISDEVKETAQKLADEGKTPLFFADERRLFGMIAVADTIKEDSPEAIAQFRKMGLKTVMLTGDNERTANAIGRQVGVDMVIAGVLPNEKESVVRRLQEQGKVAMIGDGINDTPALTRADIGIAIGAGTDIAIDAADVVLMKSRLTDAAAALRLSRRTMRNIRQNLFWAFIYNVIGIPLAAGAYIRLFGWELKPMFGAAAMSLSSVSVVTNALRLNLAKIFDTKNDRPRKDTVRELNMISTAWECMR
ncbi:Cu2+-exporting ATPase [Ruminococcus sp. YE71]|uniref:heavy metal translocating P-type ATPase n=1 Tax=unclassified Ruminococcus TaxID=2608920 RepID=UPI00088BDFFC|nr:MULTISPECIES: heavy metal translocating P-type ATPase [unclassified Ruminococcus]SDA28143.1 Cu2+-exporting ATPase [Ruminococcus sp. YE78]SFW35198.1 Cu2+-exporting ATPase [Ruminococcus sp. YE71]